MSLENLICNAYTFIEFGKSFDNYYNDSLACCDLSEKEAKTRWESVKSDYKEVSHYMSDKSLKEVQQFIIKER